MTEEPSEIEELGAENRRLKKENAELKESLEWEAHGKNKNPFADPEFAKNAEYLGGGMFVKKKPKE